MINSFFSRETKQRHLFCTNLNFYCVALLKVYHLSKVIILLLCHQRLFTFSHIDQISHMQGTVHVFLIPQAGFCITCSLFISIPLRFLWSRLPSAWDFSLVNLPGDLFPSLLLSLSTQFSPLSYQPTDTSCTKEISHFRESIILIWIPSSSWPVSR